MHGHEHEEDTNHNQRYSGGDVPTLGGAEFPYTTMFDSHSPTFDLTNTDTKPPSKKKKIYGVPISF